ncbi:hypothetical protein cypCar_00017838, partial [Cyprinus carpio]
MEQAKGTTYGKKSTFQCKEPAQLVGTNNTLTCMEDGLWSFPEALCELRCPVPPPVPSAVLQTKRCNETGLKVGTLCKYKCKPGYHVANKPKRRAFKRQCTEDGRWLEGSCEPVTCPPPPSVFYGKECELSCRDNNNDVVILPSNMTASSIMRHHWMNPPKVKHIVCTMGLKWYPHPEVLHCIKGCERPKKIYEDEDVEELYTKPFMGDNYCDAINNRAYCNYDGGDCCHSTVKTKK